MFKKIFTIVSSALVGLVLMATPAFAAEDKPAVWLQISPVYNRVMLEAGQELDYSFTVSNIGSEEFSYSVYATPYSVTGEDYNVNFSNETPRTQISRWIKFYENDGTLVDTLKTKIAPDEKQTIKYHISVPEDIPEGGQYATIFAESENDGDLGNSSGVKTVSRVGLIIYGRTNGETKDAAEITEMNVPTFLTGGKFAVSSLVKNSGNTDFVVNSEFNVQTIFGRVVYEDNNSYDVLPDTERRLKGEWEATPFMGIFRAHYKVSAIDQTEEQNKIIIILPVFMMIITLLLLTALIIWIIILSRKRRERKSRLLV